MEYYDEIASGYNELHEKEQKAKFRLIKDHLEIKKEDIILDVGYGTGLLSDYFNIRIVGLEPSRGMLRQAKKGERDADYVQGVVEYLPFADRVFDCVICVSALHNFEKPEKGLLEIMRVGRGSGAITVLKKAEKAHELKSLVKGILPIWLEIEEEKDTIYLF
jgi:ubiquinone/menaquinone biosynthesis C-methylase UbiE